MVFAILYKLFLKVVKVFNIAYQTQVNNKTPRIPGTQGENKQLVTPSFYCRFSIPYTIILLIVSSSKKIWIVYPFQGNYLMSLVGMDGVFGIETQPSRIDW